LVKLAEALDAEVFELLKPISGIPDDAASILVKYSEETLAVLDKALETMKKETSRSMAKLRGQYLSKKQNHATLSHADKSSGTGP
jgi:hypothetical protein